MSGAAAAAATFAALYTETNADVLAFLLRRCSTPEDAADCLAETYLVASMAGERAGPRRFWLTPRSGLRSGRTSRCAVLWPGPPSSRACGRGKQAVDLTFRISAGVVADFFCFARPRPAWSSASRLYPGRMALDDRVWTLRRVAPDRRQQSQRWLAPPADDPAAVQEDGLLVALELGAPRGSACGTLTGEGTRVLRTGPRSARCRRACSDQP